MIELDCQSPDAKPGPGLRCGLLDWTEEYCRGRLLEMAEWKVTGWGVRLTISLQWWQRTGHYHRNNQYLCSLFTVRYISYFYCVYVTSKLIFGSYLTLQLQICHRYWMDGKPTGVKDDVCVAVYARENFFKAWGDTNCKDQNKKWICEKPEDNWGWCRYLPWKWWTRGSPLLLNHWTF